MMKIHLGYCMYCGDSVLLPDQSQYVAHSACEERGHEKLARMEQERDAALVRENDHEANRRLRRELASRDVLIEQLEEALERMVRSGKAHGPAELGIVRTSYDAHCRAAAALTAYREWKEKQR